MKNIAIIGPSFSGKSELAKTISLLEPKSVVLNIKNICTYYAIKNGANADQLNKVFTGNEVKEAINDYIETHKIDRNAPSIWDGLSEELLEDFLENSDFQNETVIILIKKMTNLEDYNRMEKLLKEHKINFIPLEFNDNKLSLTNIFR